MSKHEKYTRLKRQIALCLITGVALFSATPMAYAATSVVANTKIPTGGNFASGSSGKIDSTGTQVNITQNQQNAVITWNDFSVGGSAVVNFDYKGKQDFNTLNYVIGNNISQIYGTINAVHDGYAGNIYIVNPAGVQIGNSAQINVGSLYVSTNTLDDTALKNFYDKAGSTVFQVGGTPNADAELMSLGNINATNVTFEGNGRIVIDTERIKDAEGKEKLGYKNIQITTNDKNNIVVGYKAYDEEYKTYEDANSDGAGNEIATVNGNAFYKNDGYMWVEDVEQLQAINTNLKGNYALRNSIDATGTAQKRFTSIGNTEAFSGKFDGIKYNIFGLTITGTENNAGLFAQTNCATINNVTLVGGSITGGSKVGAIVGNAVNTTLTNVVNSAAITGTDNVGGIVGSSTNSVITDAVNTGTITGTGENVGGLIGSMTGDSQDKSQLIGNSYNLGNVSSTGANVGGLVGYAVNSTIGDGTNLVYNVLDVTGAYNVGGIVGNMVGSTVQNAENSGTVTVSGKTTELYSYHTADESYDMMGDSAKDGKAEVEVYVANVGGIAGLSSGGSTIQQVTNTGDIDGGKQDGNAFYDAGNVGGIVGKATDTNITNATNSENTIRGAHNVGGVAGYFGGTGRITTGINDGGDIQATGARAVSNSVHNVNMTNTTNPGDTYFHDGNVHDGYAWEHVRDGNTGVESAIIGNMGGVVGYMEGDKVFVASSANRGTVHTAAFEASNVPNYAKAANVGGVVGKIDRTETAKFDAFKKNYANAAVSNSYNTGKVSGYTGVGGVVGMMYNGEIAGSYNLGAINTTRQPVAGAGSYDSVNMGGIVGDTTENANASVRLYDVYNKGQIGDQTYRYYARHVGGVVGRLSGEVDKAYNTGAIYNGYNVVGGIAGWFSTGKITNSFNTGNITVVNKENTDAGSQVGGIAGGAMTTETSISNAYNLGTLRSFQNTALGVNRIGGIVGAFLGDGDIQISNVYTTGNLYAKDSAGNSTTDNLGGIYGKGKYTTNDGTIQNAYYIKPTSNEFHTLTTSNQNGTAIEYNARFNEGSYDGFVFANQQENGQVYEEKGAWRIYEGSSLPILNAFLPNTEKYFTENGLVDKKKQAGFGVQYGTAYDPLLTIIRADSNVNNLTFDWTELGVNNAAGFAVYGSGLTIDNFMSTGGSGYFSGLLYSDGALAIHAKQNEEAGITGDISLGSSSKLYGSSVSLDADGTVTIYGEVTATGNIGNGATTLDSNDTKDYENATGEIKINAGKVDIYGKLNANTNNASIDIPGIDSMADAFEPGTVDNANVVMQDIGERFAYETIGAKDGVTGNISITTTDENDGHVNLYFGNKEEGLITAGGDLTVNATGDVYVDSDLSIGGNLALESSGETSEVLLDITNIGQVQAKNDPSQDSLDYFHKFMHHFSDVNDDGNTITLTTASGDGKLTIDMWDYETNAYDLKKYDDLNQGGHKLVDELNNLKITSNKITEEGTVTIADDARMLTYIWASTAEQLQGINKNETNGLKYNYALKGDINASGLSGYVAIGTGSQNGFTGTFDGRGNRIIGLDATKKSDGSDQTLVNAGIFSQIGEGGTVKNVNIYSSNFTGTETAGAVAGVNNGRIEGIVTFGNTVKVGDNGHAGGIVGKNTSGEFDVDGILTEGIYDVESTGSVIAGTSAIVGGLVGTNEGGLSNSFSNSAVTSAGTLKGLGGVVGNNTDKGKIHFVDSLGVTNGGMESSNVGGIVGINDGILYSAYNESIVSGNQYVGGIGGKNTNSVTNVVNATRVTGKDYVYNGTIYQSSMYIGGLVGTNGTTDNSGTIENGRNNGEITGNQFVGGLVGSNEDGSTLKNLVNDSSAAITGEQYVGGIAGSNAGTITATNEDTEEGSDTLLINRGTITGQQYVGGVAGVNENGGRIENTNNDVELFVKDSTKSAQYFGGVAGMNENGATIGNATNTADVNADGASYVGGVVGLNKGTLENMAGNTGNVTGKDFVGGVAGRNESEISGVIAENSGFVTATDGGAGGIFAVNIKDITNSWFSSKGEVSGKKDDDQTVYGTGGIFGVNEGAISGSVLENIGYTDEDGEYRDSLVTGDSNTGGLIGYNMGSVTESTLRNEANIEVEGEVQNIGGLIGYNKGQITGGRDNLNSYYKYQIYNTGTIKVTGNGTNIGGLFGTNIGKVTAAYNTGAIYASTSTNVGGIAGSNTSTLDQVFNTVIAGVDSETGSTLYGSIAGGKNVGGLVGWNSDTGNLQNAYNTTKVEGLTTYGNAVGNNAGDICNIYATNSDGTLVGQNDKLIENSYSFSAEDKGIMGITVLDVDAQKKGDSYTSFADFDKTWRIYDDYSNPLLKVFLTTLTIDADKVGDMTYNAEDQNLALGTLVGNAITAPTADLSKGENGNDTPKHDAFNGLDAYYSTINSNDPYYKGDSFLLGNTDDQVNKGDYANWLFSQQIAASNTKENAGTPVLGYDIVYTNTGADTGLKINALTLDISLDDIYRTYGDVANIFSDSDRKQGTKYDQSYSIEGYDSWSQKLKDALGTIIVEKKGDGSLLPDDKTQNVGAYDWSATVTLSNTSGNIQLNDTGATSVELTGVDKAHVEKAELSFGAQDVTINLGDKPIYTASQEPNFVNDDVFDIDYGVSNVNSSLESTVGTHEDIIGFWYNGQFYDGDSAGLSLLFGGNYNVTFTPADLTVKEKVAPTYPDIPAWEFPGGRWDYLYSDAPFDRNKDFRERKAEINFVDGGMEL